MFLAHHGSGGGRLVPGIRSSPSVVAGLCGSLLLGSASLLSLGCGGGRTDVLLDDWPGTAPDGDGPEQRALGGGGGVGGGVPTDDLPHLIGTPYVFAPTTDQFGLQVVALDIDDWKLGAWVRSWRSDVWTEVETLTHPAEDVTQWQVTGLEPGRLYDYAIVATRRGEAALLYQGQATTQRPAGESFRFALLADPHVHPREILPGAFEPETSAERTLMAVTQDIRASDPDFVINLGDVLDFHDFGFVLPPPSGSWTRWGYLNYRRFLGDTLGHAPHFAVIGNWDGENGDFTPEEIQRSREQRLLYLPGPTPETYPEGASPYEDYYAFTWGDALFVVLNVMSYTPTSHRLGNDPGVPDDWTLGEPQLDWLERTLADAESKWRFLLIHHAVGGAAGDDLNSAYGRGGGQAAYVGEQAHIHELMLRYGVQIFFYGHDHVFTDIVVDGIHYTLPGSAGAPWKFTTETGYTQYWTNSGHGLVHVSPESVTVDFVAEGGGVLYSYSVD